jgi:hypothetical protein
MNKPMATTRLPRASRRKPIPSRVSKPPAVLTALEFELELVPIEVARLPRKVTPAPPQNIRTARTIIYSAIMTAVVDDGLADGGVDMILSPFKQYLSKGLPTWHP